MIDDDEWSSKLSLLFLVGFPLCCFPAFLVSRFPDSGASLFVETWFPAFALADFRVAQRKFVRKTYRVSVATGTGSSSETKKL
jgi:hypothetical protein